MPSRSAPDLGQSISAYQTHMEAKGYAASTRKAYTDSLLMLEHAFGRQADPKTILLDDLEAIVATWRINPNTKRARIAAWRGFWKWGAKRHGWVNVAADLDLPRRSKAAMRRLTQPEVAAMLEANTVERALTVVWVLAYSAVRISELLRLRWRDVDLVAGRVTVSALAKGQKGRIVPITPELIAYLAMVKETRGDAHAADRCFVIPHRRRARFIPDDEATVWTKGTSQMSIGRILKAAAKQAGVHAADDVTAHMFRRFYLEWSLDHGMDIYVAKAIAGHESIQTTAEYGGRASLAATTRAVRGISFGNAPDGADGRTWVRTKAVPQERNRVHEVEQSEPARPDSGGEG